MRNGKREWTNEHDDRRHLAPTYVISVSVNTIRGSNESTRALFRMFLMCLINWKYKPHMCFVLPYSEANVRNETVRPPMNVRPYFKMLNKSLSASKKYAAALMCMWYCLMLTKEPIDRIYRFIIKILYNYSV